ncbi:DUF2232 domain-containing protein [Pseudochelatococcus sp. B33]
MATIFLIGSGAGLVSALLFGIPIWLPVEQLLAFADQLPRGFATLLVVALFIASYFAPIPVLIAAIRWNHRSGLVAAVVGALVSTTWAAPSAGAVFAVAVALPAWWLAYLALLGRSDEAGRMEWYPLGRILLWIAVMAALITLIGAIAFGPSYTDYRAAMEELIRAMIGEEPIAALPDQTEAERFVRVVAAAVPVVAAVTIVYMLTVNLWIAGLVLRASKRLPREWPSIPDTMMPRVSLLVAGLAAIGTAMLPEYPGLAAAALLGAMGTALSLQGLAAIHVATRGNRVRPLLLALLYTSLLLLSVWALAILAVVGAVAIAWQPRPGGPPQPG